VADKDGGEGLSRRRDIEGMKVVGEKLFNSRNF
jgi:hypothetical protein